MKSYFTAVLLILSISLFAQNFSLQYGEETKIRGNYSVPKFIGHDATGMYFQMHRVKVKYLTSDHYDEIHSLIKYDMKLEKAYSYEYDDNLKGSETHGLHMIKGNLFLFSFSHNTKEKKFSVYASTINKENGKLNGALKELFVINVETKKSNPSLFVFPTADSSGITIAVSYYAENKIKNDITILDLELNQVSKTIFSSQDQSEINYINEVFQLTNKNVIVTSLIEKNNSKKVLIYKGAALTSYSPAGKANYTAKIELGDNFILSMNSLIIEKNHLITSGFFASIPNPNEPDGFFINKYNIESGELESSSSQLFSTQIKEDSIAIKKQSENSEIMPYRFITRQIFIDPLTNTPLFLTEAFYMYIYSTPETFNNKTSYVTNLTFINAGLQIIETNSKYEISNISSIPKAQRERVQIQGNFGSIGNDGSTAVAIHTRSTLDFFSSYKSFIYKNKLLLLMNDHSANGNVKKQTDKPKEVNDMSVSSTYILTYDLLTKTLTRKALFANTSEIITIAKEAFLLGDEIYLYGTQPHVMGYSNFRLAKVKIK
jgi:hypothetical protein